MITITEEDLQTKVDALKQQREQALATINMVDGALQICDDLLKNHQSMTLKDLGEAVGGKAEIVDPVNPIGDET